MIVRWGLGELEGALSDLGVSRPFLLATGRHTDVPRHVGRWSDLPTDDVAAVVAELGNADVLVALGGGSTIDAAKAVSAETSLPLLSIPTTYSGAEWTSFFGVRDGERRQRGGGAGANVAAIVYEPELTLDLPRAETVGTALNALAHCAEALYVEGHNERADTEALV
ncbi:MAG: iron-containing alcohol dehydrogenase, partial [Actinobacteria bacterium]|nr:iron-containing alcohol dehydrogenase [Actinomycetota bacterium]